MEIYYPSFLKGLHTDTTANILAIVLCWSLRIYMYSVYWLPVAAISSWKSFEEWQL